MSTITIIIDDLDEDDRDQLGGDLQFIAVEIMRGEVEGLLTDPRTADNPGGSGTTYGDWMLVIGEPGSGS